MEKEEILKLINQQIEKAIKKLKKELGVREESDEREGKRIKDKNLQEFIDEKEPRKVASEEIPVIAYYLRDIDRRRLQEVDEKIIRVAYKRINRSRPKRIKQVFIDSDYFEKVAEKQGFYGLNDDGDYFIEVSLEERKKRGKNR